MNSSGNVQSVSLPFAVFARRPCPRQPFLPPEAFLLSEARAGPVLQGLVSAGRAGRCWPKRCTAGSSGKVPSGSTGRAGEIGSAGNVVCLLSPQLFAANKWVICSSEGGWESIAVPQRQNADSTWHNVFFHQRTLFPLLRRKFWFTSSPLKFYCVFMIDSS